MNNYQDFERLQFDRTEPNVLRVQITSPLKMNVMDARLHSELAAIWAVADQDSSVSVILLCGSSEAFSAGGDLVHQQDVLQSHELQMQVLKETRQLVYGMINCSKIVVSSVRGWAVGSGLACALLADISVASKTAKLADGHVKIGVTAGDHSVLIWPLLCGLAKTKLYTLLGERLDGAEAERIGLISLAVDDAEVDERAAAIAAKLAESSQHALRGTKYALNGWLRNAGPLFDTSLAYEVLGFSGPDAREGLAAFLEKRPARF